MNGILLTLLIATTLLFATGTVAAEELQVSLTLAGRLLGPASDQLRLSYELDFQGIERRTAQSPYRLSLSTGNGTVTVHRQGHAPVIVPATAELEWTPAPPQVLADGPRIWTLRGDLHLQPVGQPTYHVEFGARLTLPLNGDVLQMPEPPGPGVGQPSRASTAQLMDRLAQQGCGGGNVLFDPQLTGDRAWIGEVRQLKGVVSLLPSPGR